VFAPVSTTEPLPALIRPAGLAVPPMVFWIRPMERSSGEVPEVVRVRFAPASSTVDAMVGMEARLLLMAVTPALPKVRMPPVILIALVPPVPLKVALARVLLPTSVNVPAPLMVKLLVLAMEPLLVLCVALALLRIRLPGIK